MLFFLEIQDGKGNGVGNIDAFNRKYCIDPDGNHIGARYSFEFYEIKSNDERKTDHDHDRKIIKVRTDKHLTDSDVLEDILSKWISVVKLSIIEGAEIYDDHGYGKYNAYMINSYHNRKMDIHLKFPKVILVQKLYKSDLNEYIESHKEFNNMFIMELNKNMGHFMREIVPKLKIMHDNGLIHGDLKPRNIVVDYKSGEDGKSYFISFGIIDFEEVSEINGWKNRMIGTEKYHAPELKENNHYYRITTKLDVFALGMSVLRLLSGKKHPYDNYMKCGEDPQDMVNKDILHKIVDECIVSRENLLFKDLIRNMIEYDADKRYDIADIMNHPWYQRHCKISELKRKELFV